MSETIIRFSTTELTTVRIRCRGCGGVVELSADRLAGALVGGICRFCRAHLVAPDRAGTVADPLVQLAHALAACRLAAATSNTASLDGGDTAEKNFRRRA